MHHFISILHILQSYNILFTTYRTTVITNISGEHVYIRKLHYETCTVERATQQYNEMIKYR